MSELLMAEVVPTGYLDGSNSRLRVGEDGWFGPGWVKTCLDGNLSDTRLRLGEVIRENISPPHNEAY